MKQTNTNQFYSDEELDCLLYLICDHYRRSYPGFIVGRQRFVVSDINAQVERSLEKKYPVHVDGYSTEKLAGAYSFWIAKLKPLYVVDGAKLKINEVAAYGTAACIIKQLHGKTISIDTKRYEDFLSMLRYHTTSPHSLTSFFSFLV